MKRWLPVLIFCASIMIGCGQANDPPPTMTTKAEPSKDIEPAITILAFGDSLTEGFGVSQQESYPTQLKVRLQADGYSVDVINGGISGETSSAALSRIDWMIQNTQPDIVVVEIGANDALRGVDLALTSANIDEIIRRISESNIIVVLAGMQIVQNLGEDYVDAFAQIYPDVAAKHDSILIPFFLEGVATDPDLNQPDFIHPNADGYQVLVGNIYPFILEAIEQAAK